MPQLEWKRRRWRRHLDAGVAEMGLDGLEMVAYEADREPLDGPGDQPPP